MEYIINWINFLQCEDRVVFFNRCVSIFLGKLFGQMLGFELRSLNGVSVKLLVRFLLLRSCQLIDRALILEDRFGLISCHKSSFFHLLNSTKN